MCSLPACDSHLCEWLEKSPKFSKRFENCTQEVVFSLRTYVVKGLDYRHSDVEYTFSEIFFLVELEEYIHTNHDIDFVPQFAISLRFFVASLLRKIPNIQRQRRLVTYISQHSELHYRHFQSFQCSVNCRNHIPALNFHRNCNFGELGPSWCDLC